jgi:hypothetical protein
MSDSLASQPPKRMNATTGCAVSAGNRSEVSSSPKHPIGSGAVSIWSEMAPRSHGGLRRLRWPWEPWKGVRLQRHVALTPPFPCLVHLPASDLTRASQVPASLPGLHCWFGRVLLWPPLCCVTPHAGCPDAQQLLPAVHKKSCRF